jgi:valyl-tRNA synthetase
MITWSKLADWYLEIAKVEGDKDEILLYILERLLVILHPFAPFVTEELWKNFQSGEMLMVHPWPQGKASAPAEAQKDFALVQDIITNLRNIRSEYKIEPKKRVKAVIASSENKDLISAQAEVIKSLARLEDLQVEDAYAKAGDTAAAILPGAEIYLLLEGAVDLARERENLRKEKENLEKFIASLEAKLQNDGFVRQAPPAIVAQEKEKLTTSKEQLAKVEEKLKNL